MKPLPQKGRIALAWGIVAAVAVAIFCFSAQNAEESGEVSGSLSMNLYSIYTRLFGLPCIAGGSDLVLQIEHILRKLAHMSIYLVLGFFVANAFVRSGCRLRTAMFAAVAVTFLYGVTDEFHQLFVPGRSCQFSDMLIDGTGGAIGVLIYRIVFNKAKSAAV